MDKNLEIGRTEDIRIIPSTGACPQYYGQKFLESHLSNFEFSTLQHECITLTDRSVSVTECDLIRHIQGKQFRGRFYL